MLESCAMWCELSPHTPRSSHAHMVKVDPQRPGPLPVCLEVLIQWYIVSSVLLIYYGRSDDRHHHTDIFILISTN